MPDMSSKSIESDGVKFAPESLRKPSIFVAVQLKGRKCMRENLSKKPSKEYSTADLNLVIGPTEVADVMTGKVITLSPHHGLSDAVNLMKDRFFRHCVVVDNDRKVVGVISDRDILRVLARASNWQNKSLDQIMTRAPYTVRRETPIGEAVAKMLAKRINCLPVVTDSGTVCGIVTSTDLLRSYQQLLELIQKQAK
jgi:acetoin utilization protein AcuB